MPVEAPAVSEHQQRVLYALKRRGEGTVEDIASSLGMTVSGARQHLTALADLGLVATEAIEPATPGTATPGTATPGSGATGAGSVGRGRGRPKHRYRLTPAAEPLFPKAYGELTNELLSYAADEDGTIVERIFVRRRDQRIANAQARLAGKRSLTARVRELARILDEDGYLADFESLGRGRYRVTEHNCAILSVARQHPHACASEIDFIRAVLPDTTVERVEHIIAGQHHCAYLITPTAS